MVANRTTCGPFVLACACLAHGCASQKPEQEMLRHDWRLTERIQDTTSDRATADAQAKVLAALIELRAALEKSSASASASRSDLAAILRQADGDGAPFPASFADPKTLEEDISRLLTEADAAPTRLLTQFRDFIKGRSNPDGMDPVRRAILDHEIRMRQTGRR